MKKKNILFLCNILVIYFLVFQILNAQIYSDEQIINPLDPTFSKRFAYESSIWQNYLLVGDYNDSTRGEGAGAAYIFRYTPSGWEEQQKIIPNDVGPLANFGQSVYLFNEYAIIGAPNHWQVPGSVYIYKRTNNQWQQIQKITSPDPFPSYQISGFGNSIDFDGRYLTIADLWGPDLSGIRDGAVYVYRLESNRFVYTGEKLTSSHTQLHIQSFGKSVSISGEYILVGAPELYEPKAYLFKRTPTGYIEHAIFPGIQGSDFGKIVGLSKKYAVIGAPTTRSGGLFGIGAVHIYENVSENWLPNSLIRPIDLQEYDQFGHHLSLCDSIIVIGAPGFNDDRGRSFVYQKTSSIWQETARIYPSNNIFQGSYGIRVNLSRKHISIGQPGRLFTSVHPHTLYAYKLNIPQIYFYHNSRFVNEPLLLGTSVCACDITQIPNICADGADSTTFIAFTNNGYAGNINDFRIRIKEDPNGNNVIEYGLVKNPSLPRNDSLLFAYQHPKIVDMSNNDIYKEFTLEVINIAQNDSIYMTYPIRIYRAPVLMVHGIWTDANSFRTMEYNLDLWPWDLTSVANYEQTNSFQFHINRNVVKNEINGALNKAIDNGFSVAKVNVVAHSMGGILSRLYLQSLDYGNDICRLILLNTPHSGSQMANYIDIHASNLLRSTLNLFGKNPYAGAVSDLKVDSDAIRNDLNGTSNLNNNFVPSAAIISTTSASDGTLLYFLTNLIIAPYQDDSPSFRNDYVSVIFNNEANDVIVAESSQLGGLANYTHYNHEHEGASSDPDIINQTNLLLNASPDDPILFNQSGFQPVTLNYNFVPPPLKNNIYTDEFIVNNNSIVITSPNSGDVYNPGDIVTVNIQYDSLVSAMVFMAGNQGITPFSEYTVQPTSTFIYQIPQDAAGAINLAVYGYGDSSYSTFDTTFINIGLPSGLDSIEVNPNKIYLQVGDFSSLTVNGYFSDGIKRNINNVPNLEFDILDNSIARFVQPGLIRGIMSDTTEGTILYGGDTAYFEIIVLDGSTYTHYPPSLTNPNLNMISNEDFGILTSIDLDQIFTDLDGDSLIFNIEVTDDILSSTLIGNRLELSTVQDSSGSSTIIISAFDGSFNVADTFIVNINPVNDPPILSSISPISFYEDDSIRIDLDTLVYDVDNDDSEISWLIDISDTALTKIEHYFKNIYNGNTNNSVMKISSKKQHVITYTDNLTKQSLISRHENSINPNKSQLLNDEISISKYNNINGIKIYANNYKKGISDSIIITIDSLTNVLLITASQNFTLLDIPVIFTAIDPDSLFDSDTTTISVLPNIYNYPPIFTSYFDNIFFKEDSTYRLNKEIIYNKISDPDDPDSSLILNIIENDSIFFVWEDSAVTFSSPSNWFGYDTLMLIVSDSTLSDSTYLNVEVLSQNDPPIVSDIPDIVFPEDSSYLFDLDVYVSDVDHDTTEISWFVDFPQNIETDIKKQILKIREQKIEDYFNQKEVESSKNRVNLFNRKPEKQIKSNKESVNQDIFVVRNLDPKTINKINIESGKNFNHANNSQNLSNSVFQLGLKQGKNDSLVINVDSLSHKVFITATLNFNGLNIPVIFYAIDDSGAVGFDTTTISINQVNDPPHISPLPDTSFFEDDTLIYPIENWFSYVYDPDTPDGYLSYIVISGNNVTADPGNAVYFLHASENWYGIDTLKLIVSDSSLSDTADFYVNVIPINDPPVLSNINDIQFLEDSVFVLPLNPYVFDVDNDTTEIYFMADVLTANSKHSKKERQLINKNRVGEQSNTVNKKTGDRETKLLNSFSNIINNNLKIGVDDLIISIDSLTNIATITVTSDSTGIFEVLFTATDDSGAFDTDTMTITVQPVNDPPVISTLPTISFAEDDSLIYQISNWFPYITDPDDADSLLTYSVTQGQNVSSHRENKNYLFYANTNWHGSDSLKLIVTDSAYSDTSDLFVMVESVNDPPQITGLPDSIAFNNDTSIVLNIWSYVNDVETPDSLLTYQFPVNSIYNDSLIRNFADTTGQLTLSALPSFFGTVIMKVTVADSDTATVDSMLVNVTTITGIDEPLANLIPKEYILYQNYPNPFNPNTTIKYGLPKASKVKLEIYNLLGQKIVTLVDDNQIAGYYEAKFQLNHIASGIYFYRIEAEEFQKVKKMILMK